MAGTTNDPDSARSLQTRIVGTIKRVSGRDDINALRTELAALRAEIETMPNGPKGRIETLQELCDRLEVRINEAIELAGQPRAAERRDARIIADLERRITALEQMKDAKQ
jgi:DNA-binding Xre family transcriptional regulator